MDLILVGNPNVGKTTFFNIITGSSEHTANWSGKTVETFTKEFFYRGEKHKITDLPGIYSLEQNSLEEEIAIEYLVKSKDDLAIVLIDGTNISRGLFLYYELKQHKKEVVLIITMKDILNKNNIQLDLKKLENILNTKVILTDLKKINDINDLLDEIYDYTNPDFTYFNDYEAMDYDERIISIHKKCDAITNKVVSEEYRLDENTKKIDKILLRKLTGIPLLVFFVCSILWLSVFFSNVFQGVLYNVFNNIILFLNIIFLKVNVPTIITELLLNGGIATSLFVASVMIPPMLIFFPIFSFIEDVGLIPRISFNLDGFFSKFHCNGKNSIPMILGFGCNCVGVTSTRIFENEKSRKVAILTNNFIPCNGRLPMIIVLISTFIARNTFESTFIIIGFIFGSIMVSLLLSLALNILFKNTENNFIYELPIYKRPNIINILKLSIFDKAFYVLGKSITFSFFAGIIVVILKKIYINGFNILQILSCYLDPLGALMGLSGIILLAFIIGISANEIVLPIVFMLYSNQNLFLNSSNVFFYTTMQNNGFTIITAICMILFSLNHFPCIASLSTIKKETNSLPFTIVCAIVPLIIGTFLCICVNFILLHL